MTDIVERIKDAENATHALFNHIFQDARKEIERLRAKIEAMERQEPVVEVQWAAGIPNGILDFISTDDYLPKLGDKLYALPGAKGDSNVATD